MDLALFALGLGSDLLDRHLGFVCGFLEAFVDEDVGGVFDGIVSEDFGHLLATQFVPESIRGQHDGFVFGVELKYLDFWDGSDIVA